jgi:KipI family sensor histidine kinase inhibitor
MQKYDVNWRPLGEQALILQWPLYHADVTSQIMQLVQCLQQAPFTGFVESVPAFQSLSIHYDLSQMATVIDPHQYVADYTLKLMKSVPSYYISKSRKIEIPVFYGDSPDLAELCNMTGFSREQWIERHTSAEYKVVCVGFAPGFPYLAGLPEVLQMPRRKDPRLRVPAGSVAIGGAYCGIYPQPSPGGWHIVGRTEVCLFDATQIPPACLQVGDQVRFRAVRERVE